MAVREASKRRRVSLYGSRGRSRMVSDENILGGEPVFRGTRLSVRHIGEMHLKGEPTERILENYPMLTAEDVEFAALYIATYPPGDRPPTGRR